MQAPTIDELVKNPVVLQALDDAWIDSLPADSQRRHEEGGWVFYDIATGATLVRRAAKGTMAVIDLTSPPIVAGSVVVATFHTHPNPIAEGWNPGPSPDDERSAW